MSIVASQRVALDVATARAERRGDTLQRANEQYKELQRKYAAANARAENAEREIVKIVEWLSRSLLIDRKSAANAIERGDHRKSN